MQTDIRTFPQAPAEIAAAAPHRVLRNTYWLLSLSLLPTIAGALLGVQFKFALMPGSPFIGAMIFLAVAFGFFFAIEKFKNSAVGVGLLLAFTFFMGLWLSQLLQVTLGFRNGGTLIALAGGMTAAITFGMATLATVIKRDLSFMGNFLFVGAILLMVAGLANAFFQVPALWLVFSAIAVLLFSVYILYDVNRIVQGGETNYVTATLSLYLDIYNVFANLLVLLGVLSGERD